MVFKSWTCDWFNCVVVISSIKCIWVILLKPFVSSLTLDGSIVECVQGCCTDSLSYQRAIVPVCERRLLPLLCVETIDLIHSKKNNLPSTCRKHITIWHSITLVPLNVPIRWEHQLKWQNALENLQWAQNCHKFWPKQKCSVTWGIFIFPVQIFGVSVVGFPGFSRWRRLY